MGRVIQYSTGKSNGFIVQDQKTILVDSSDGGTERDFLEVFRKYGVRPEKIGLLIITHDHCDHFLRGAMLKRLTGARILCHRETVESLSKGLLPQNATIRDPERRRFWEEMAKKRAQLGEKPKGLDVVEPVEPDLVMDEEFNLRPYGVAGWVFSTPGHSNGSVSVQLDWGDIIVGDLIMPQESGTGMRAAIIANDEDALKKSALRIIESGATMVYSGHGRPCTMKEFRDAYEEDWDSL